MAIDVTRLFVQGVVHRMLKRIRNDPDRSLRNLIDIGVNQAKGRFQHRFFAVAQHMLSHPDSPYYQLARNVVSSTSLETLETFGMNLGYNALTVGAKKIRALEAEGGVNIPWIITVRYGGADRKTSPVDMDGLMRAGKEMGIYSYAFMGTARDLAELDGVFATHSDCALLLFIQPGETSVQALAWSTAHRHAMVSLSLRDPALDEASAVLREKGCLRCLFMEYADAICGGAAEEEAMKKGDTLVFWIAAETCAPHASARVHAYVSQTRNDPRHPLAMLEYYHDLMDIDAAISTQPCFLAVTAQGGVVTTGAWKDTGESILRASLRDIICRVMPPVCPHPAPNPAFRA